MGDFLNEIGATGANGEPQMEPASAKGKKMAQPKMNPKIKARWIKALLSGKYKQGRGSLREFEINEHGKAKLTGYCCLGVLCDLFRKSTAGRAVRAKWSEDEFQWINDDSNGSISYAYHVADLPHIVAEWAGLVDEVGNLTADPKVGKAELSEHNDGTTRSDGTQVKRKNFKQIAALIERYR